MPTFALSTPVSGHKCTHPVHVGHTCARACPHIRPLVHFSTPLTGALSQRTPARAPAYKCDPQTFPARGGADRVLWQGELGDSASSPPTSSPVCGGRGAGTGASAGAELARGPLGASGRAGWEPRSPIPALRISVAQPRTETPSLRADCLVWPLSPSCSCRGLGGTRSPLLEVPIITASDSESAFNLRGHLAALVTCQQP